MTTQTERTGPIVTVWREADRLLIASPYELKDAVKAVPGRLWDKTAKMWHVPATAAGAGALAEKLRDPDVGGDPAVRLNCDAQTVELMAKAERREAVMDIKDREELPPIPGVPPSELNPEGGGWLHQRQAYWFGLELDALMLAMWMGTGKSLVAARLFDAWDTPIAVILCPVRVIRVWHRELRRWSERGWLVASGGGSSARGVPYKNPSIAQRVRHAEQLLEQGKDQRRPVAIVANYEAAWQGRYADFLPEVVAVENSVAVADESHKIKAPGGKWSRFCAKVARRSDKALAMTGTPMPSGPTALYGQFRFLDPGIFGTSYKHFQQKFFEMGGFENRIVQGFLDKPREDEFAKAMASIAYICDKSVLDLPPEIDLPAEDFTVEMSAETARRYRDLDKEFVTYVDQLVSCETCAGSGKQDDGKDCRVCKGAGAVERSGAVATPNVLSKLIRLAQVTSGYLPVEAPDGTTENVTLGTEKMDLLEETIEDIGVGPEEPVVIFCRFRQDLENMEALARKLGIRYGEISGRRDDALNEDAEMKDTVDLCAVQLQAGGVGIDLTRARYAIFYSMDFNLGDYQQSRDRVHRPGQTRETFYVFPTVRGSVDEIVQAALANRESVVKACIRHAKEYKTLAVAA